MAGTDPSQLSVAERSGLCCVYASLALHDAGSPLTEDNLNKLIKASGNKVDQYYVKMFAKAMEGQNIDELLKNLAVAAPAPAAAEEKEGKKEAQKEVKKEEKKEEPKEEEVAIGGFGDIFGDE